MMKTMIDSARAAVRPALLASVITLAVSACDEGVGMAPKRDLQQEKELVQDVEQAFKELASTLEIPESEVDSVVTQLQTIGQADLDAAIKGVARKLRADLAPVLAQ